MPHAAKPQHPMPTSRRICWPNPDATCLEGGCLHCNDAPFRALTSIRHYAERNQQVQNRGNDQWQSAMVCYNRGYSERWYGRVDFK